MITALRLQNFRGFRDSGWLEFKDLVCLLGRNSSGKSSIIHALLLFRQSFDERALGARLPQLNLNGRLIEGGTYEDIVHHHDSKTEVSFSFRFTIEPPDFDFRKIPGLPLVELDVPRLARHHPYMSYWFTRTRTRKRVTGSMDFSFLPEEPYGPTLSYYKVELDGIGSVWFSRTSGRTRVQHWRGYASKTLRKKFDIRFPSSSFFPRIVLRGTGGRVFREPKAEISNFLAHCEMATSSLSNFVEGLRMVGPFRTPPSRRFTLTSLSGLDVGISGEKAIDMLIAERLVRPKDQRLSNVLAYWMNRLQLAKAVKIDDLSRTGSIFQLSLSRAGTARKANFADVGFGISQVLPILVQGLLVRRGDLFIVQQPELHLHPDAQAGLADYFLYLASHGVNVLLETHSEYLLLRLRRRLAEGVKLESTGHETQGPTKKIGVKNVGVVLVQDGRRESSVTELELNDAFQFNNLPTGFMDQAMADRLALLDALARK